MRYKETIAVTWLVLLAACAAPQTGCQGRLAPDGAYKGDKALFYADKTINSSYKILHDFVLWEEKNRALVPLQVTRSADRVRANSEKYLQSAINLREAYALNPTGEGRSALLSAVDLLQRLLDEAASYMAPGGPPAPDIGQPQPTNLNRLNR